MKKGRKIKAVRYKGKDYVYVKRGVNDFVFTSEELNRAKDRWNIMKDGINIESVKNERI